MSRDDSIPRGKNLIEADPMMNQRPGLTLGLCAFLLLAALPSWANVITLDFEDLAPGTWTSDGDIVTHGVIIRQIEFAGDHTVYTHVTKRSNYAGGTGNELKIGMDTEFIFGQTVHELTWITDNGVDATINGEWVAFVPSAPGLPNPWIVDGATIYFTPDFLQKTVHVKVVGKIQSLQINAGHIDNLVATTPEPTTLISFAMMGGLLFRRYRAS